MFKRLCYLIAEGFEICSISGIDNADEPNGKILYRVKNEAGEWRLKSEEFSVEHEESQACARLFFDYLQSEGAS